MKMLIVGRSGRGKDKLREILETEYGWKFVKSYSTRKPRYEGEDTHIFITHKEADAIPKKDKVAVTHIKNGDDIADEYFATRKQVEECDGYIIDPNGVKMLLASMPDTAFEIAYIANDNEDKVLDMVVKRAKGNTNEIEKFKERCKDEDKQFSEFEQSVKDKTFGGDNCSIAIPLHNDYREETIKHFADMLNGRKYLYQNLATVISILKDNNTFDLDENNQIIVYENDKCCIKGYSDDCFAQVVLTDKEGFFKVMQKYLSLPDVTLSVSKESKTEKMKRNLAKEYCELLNDFHNLNVTVEEVNGSLSDTICVFDIIQDLFSWQHDARKDAALTLCNRIQKMIGEFIDYVNTGAVDRYIVEETSDAFEDPYVIRDICVLRGLYGEYYTDKAGFIKTFESKEEAEQFLKSILNK